MDITGKRVFITGGSGFLGRALTKRLLQEACDITIFSRSERPQVEMKRKFPTCNYVLGDVRDGKSLYNAMNGHDVVIHAAALKHVPIAEDQPIEAMKNNIVGSINVLECAKYIPTITHCLGISTDKAAQPASVYGMTKLLMEKMFYEVADNYPDTAFSLVRYGNVLFSSGSVIEIWIKLAKQGKKLKITVPEMTRFFFLVEDAVEVILESIDLSEEYKEKGYFCINYVPRIKACVLQDLLEVVMTKFNYDEDMVEVIGNRGNENVHEILVNESETKGSEILKNAFNGNGAFILGINEKSAEIPPYTSDQALKFTQKEISDILEDSGVYEAIE
jgi:UDP-N-acetylglucosamine 4,6-dehydratase/5-epimerase